VANQGLLSLVLTDLAFVPLVDQGAPILSNIDGDIVLTVIDQFPAHRMNISATDMYAVKTIDPAILPCGCIISEEGLGEVARGYIYDPTAQINDQGHTISLTIPNQTDALRNDTTAPGWVAATGIDTIANRLASRSPPWKASVVDTGPNVVSTRPVTWFGNDPSVSTADLNMFTKEQFYRSATARPDGSIYYVDSGYPVAAGWNVGAVTREHFDSGDGAITSVAFGCNTHRMFGLTNSFSTYSYEMLTHAIYLATDGRNLSTSGVLRVYERGLMRYDAGAGSYRAGDVFSVAVVGGQVQYMINDVVFYRSTLAPQYPCYGACSMYSPQSAILGATMTQYVAPKDTYYAVGFENATVLDALIALANRTYRHIRQKQVNGVPVQEMEIGLFGAPPAMLLKTSDAESPSQVAARNPSIRLIEPQVDYQWTTSQIVTIGAAIGGGSGDTQTDLRDLYYYLHPNPNLPGFLGPPVKMPGQTASDPPYYQWFPEYLEDTFPIEQRVSLSGNFYYVVKNVAAIAQMKAKGHWSGEIWGDVSDSSIAYVDQSPDAQRQAVQRALYVSVVTKLKSHAMIHFTATLQVEGRGRITQAGDLIDVRITRVGRAASVGGGITSFMAADFNAQPTVMQWTRKYREQDVTDEVKVSTLARLLGNDNTALTDTLRKVDAVRLIPDTKESDVYIGPIEQTINSIYPLDIPIDLPTTMTKMVAVSIRVTAKPARHNVSLTKGAKMDGAHDHAVTIPALTVQTFNLVRHGHESYTVTHDHGGINTSLGTSGNTDISHAQGTSVGAFKGGTGVTANVTGTSSHYHDWSVQNIGAAPSDGSRTLWLDSSGRVGRAGFGAAISTTGGMTVTDASPTNHGHADGITVGGGGNVNNLPFTSKVLSGGSTPINFATSTIFRANTGTPTDNNAGTEQFIGVTTTITLVTHATDGGQLSGAHTHDLLPDVAETNLGSSFQIHVDSGDGVYVDRSPEMGGPWVSRDALIKGNVNGVGTGAERFFQAPGKKVGIRLVAINSAGNPTGIQNVQVVALLTYEKSAIASTIFAQ
jgi:hypothetical protein